MNIFNGRAKKFSNLPLLHFDTLSVSVHVLCKGRNYLYVNHPLADNFGQRTETFFGKNRWARIPALSTDTAFAQMKLNIEKGINVKLVSTSPQQQTP